jgi:hypothetical protein
MGTGSGFVDDPSFTYSDDLAAILSGDIALSRYYLCGGSAFLFAVGGALQYLSFVDLNGDGLPDLVASPSGGSWEAWLNTVTCPHSPHG